MQPRMTCRRYAACSQRWLCRQVVLGYVWLFSSHAFMCFVHCVEKDICVKLCERCLTDANMIGEKERSEREVVHVRVELNWRGDQDNMSAHSTEN
ncbi:hypothetical protein ACSQ67_009135 [Phaseolus vulgaris]